jgi:hypothetical protein
MMPDKEYYPPPARRWGNHGDASALRSRGGIEPTRSRRASEARLGWFAAGVPCDAGQPRLDSPLHWQTPSAALVAERPSLIDAGSRLPRSAAAG